ncbi:MAG: SusC/RagA family TonB-linked outer membrane protein [Longimicrobiales bacterium]
MECHDRPPAAFPGPDARHRNRCLRVVSLFILGTLALAGPAAGQSGTVSGRITEIGTGRSLASVQVTLANTGLGTLTNQEGRFQIPNVPPGSYSLRVQRLGYGTMSRDITVASGQTLVADFELTEEVLGLDEIVVTGTAGAARRREIGNSISQINVAELSEPPVNVDALLQARVPGMSVLQNSAAIGSGAQIRLRGNVSVAMSNQPILYIDGIRVRSEGYARNVPPSGSQLRSNNDISSPLNDISPLDIERIEVIKGSAATTLYGTEAAAGVIQIFTKRGHQGRASWTASVEQGVSYVQPFGPDPSTMPPSELENPDGTPKPRPFCDDNGDNCGTSDYLFINPWLRNAHRQKYTLSVGGGGEALRYFVSGALEDNEGVLPNDSQEKYVVRGNFAFSPIQQLQLEWNTSFTSDALTGTPGGNNAHGITLNAYRRDRNYLGAEVREAIDTLLTFEIDTQIDHLITGVSATYSPTANFSNRLSVGYDQAQLDLRNFRPFLFALAPNGILSDRRYEYSTLTVDYVGNFDTDLTPDLRSTLSWGGQSVATEEQETSAYGETFPGPGDPTVSSAGLTLGFEDRERVINAGFFVQNLFDYKDRYFLTAGLRVDGNSSFGENLGLAVYPKASLSYIISDEPFWPDGLGQLKLRAAYGHSGRAPGAFDKARTFDPVGWGTLPAFVPENVGNADIGPERTAETELGFDGAFLNNRLAVDFTWYNRRTTDALFDVRQIPSLGFTNSQLQNIGELLNRGVELSMTGTLLRTDRLTWDLGGSLSTNFSKVVSLGGAPEFLVGGGDFAWIVEGEPVPLIRARCLRNEDKLEEPEYFEEDCNIGPNLPTHIVGLFTTLQLPAGISLSARGEFQGGHYMYDGAAWNAVTRSVRWPGCFEAYRVEETMGRDAMTAKQRSQCDVQLARADDFIYKADFIKLREVTLSVPVPQRLLPQATRALLVLSGRNVWKWVNDDFPVFDPEMGNNDGFNTFERSLLEHVPPPATYTAAIRVTF